MDSSRAHTAVAKELEQQLPQQQHPAHEQQLTQPAQHACQHCARVFRQAWRLNYHIKNSHPAEPWRCGNCGKCLATHDALARHERTAHKSQYTFRCKTCGKGFTEQKRLKAHVAAHTQAGMETLAPPRDFWPQQLRAMTARHSELLKQLAATARPQCDSASCKVGTRDRADTAFLCSECNMYWHWDCAGYVREMVGDLPLLVCPQCLHNSGKPADTCYVAATNYRLLHEFIATIISGTLGNVPADGWCLIRSVATALGRDHKKLLNEAVRYIVNVLGKLEVADDERIQIGAACQKILNGNTRTQMGRLWDSVLTDQLPTGLAGVVQRPLHILEASDGVVRLTVVPVLQVLGEGGDNNVAATAVAALGEPIMLARTMMELGVDHYDLVMCRP